MWIFRYTYCIFQGHAFVDVTASRRPYQYCLRCGKVHTPGVAAKTHLGYPGLINP